MMRNGCGVLLSAASMLPLHPEVESTGGRTRRGNQGFRVRQGLSISDLRQRIRPVNQPPVGVVSSWQPAWAPGWPCLHAWSGDDGTARKEITWVGWWGINTGGRRSLLGAWGCNGAVHAIRCRCHRRAIKPGHMARLFAITPVRARPTTRGIQVSDHNADPWHGFPGTKDGRPAGRASQTCLPGGSRQGRTATARGLPASLRSKDQRPCPPTHVRAFP